ncbi:MAG TPA: GNAT family N-acetyltransferase [Candidatus Dormibacteraeota bacterium]
MNPWATLCIVTPRLLVRDLAEDDLAAVHAFRADPRVTRFMGFLPETLAESRGWLTEAVGHNRLTPRHAFNFGIVLHSDRRLIGWIGIGQSQRDRAPGTFGLSYMLHSAHHGRGYMTEAARVVVAFGFGVLRGQRVGAWCYAENHASVGVLRKVGLVLQRRYWDEDPTTGQPEECLEFAVSLEEWLAR